MAADLSVFFNANEFAESVTYAGNAITAIVERSLGKRENSVTAQGSVKQATLFVKESDVSAPAYRDAVVIDGDTWHVIEIPGRAEEGIWRLEIETEMKPVL